MNTADLQNTLDNLWQQGLELWLEGEQLRFKGNKQLLSSEVMSTLRDNKDAITAILQQTPDAFLGFPLSQGQRGIYLMQNMAKDSAIYNQSCVLRLASDVDLAVLARSEEHTSELQSRPHLVCRLLLEKKKTKTY